MSQITHEDIEMRNDAVDGDQLHSSQNQPLQPLQGKFLFGDSSERLFSIYSKAAKEEDDDMVERWQKDAEGILIFTGLFSAAVAALLSVTVQDLKPNPQDTSAFYLRNIHEALINPNEIRTPPSTAAKSPFSPTRNAFWVNLLWFLSLILSLSCALLATSLQQWARRYIRLTQPARCSPERRARMRAFFYDGKDKMQIRWAVEGLPTLLHISLFLFFGGIIVYLHNINHEIFLYAICCIGLFSVVYGTITLLPLIRKDSPYYAPLTKPAWYLYAGIPYIIFKVLAFITFKPSQSFDSSHQTGARLHDLEERYRGLMQGLERVTEEIVMKRSSEIDIRILDWTISALGDEDTLETFFESIPGFFDSRIVKLPEGDFTEEFFEKFQGALEGFLDRTWSSNSVSDVDKLRRLDICMNAMNCIRASEVSSILHNILSKYWDEVPQSVEAVRILGRWCTSDDHRTFQYAQSIIALILGHVRDYDDSWIALATHTYGIPENNIDHSRDSVLFAVLIKVTRLFIHPDFAVRDIVPKFSDVFSGVDILKTLPGQQHEFCALWNEIVDKAKNWGTPNLPVQILRTIRHHYTKLHHDTGASPTMFSSAHDLNPILNHPDTYHPCRIFDHHPGSDPRFSQSDPSSYAVTHSTHTPSGHSLVVRSPHSTPHSSAHAGQSDNANVIIEPPSPSVLSDPQVSAAIDSALPFMYAPFAPRGASQASRASTSNSSLSSSSSVDFSSPASRLPEASY